MGAAHSSEPRSVSMDNPTPAGVIDISDDVVNRLKLGITKQGTFSMKHTIKSLWSYEQNQ